MSDQRFRTRHRSCNPVHGIRVAKLTLVRVEKLKEINRLDTMNRFGGALSSDPTSYLLREFTPDLKRLLKKHTPEKVKRIERRLPIPENWFGRCDPMLRDPRECFSVMITRMVSLDTLSAVSQPQRPRDG